MLTLYVVNFQRTINYTSIRITCQPWDAWGCWDSPSMETKVAPFHIVNFMATDALSTAGAITSGAHAVNDLVPGGLISMCKYYTHVELRSTKLFRILHTPSTWTFMHDNTYEMTSTKHRIGVMIIWQYFYIATYYSPVTAICLVNAPSQSIQH